MRHSPSADPNAARRQVAAQALELEGSARCQRRFHVDDHGQRVVVRLHRTGGVDGRRLGLGHDDRHGLTHEPDGPVGQQGAWLGSGLRVGDRGL